MQVIVNPYHRSVTIDGVEVVQKILEFPNELNHLSTISCTYDSSKKKITDVHDLHRFTSNYIEREYFFTTLPVFVDWYYREKQAQVEETARQQKYKQDVENAITQTVNAGLTAQANIKADKDAALTSITTAKNSATSDITSRRTEAVSAIQANKIEALNAITDTTNSSVSSVTGAMNTALNNIATDRASAVNAIANDKTNALEAIATDRRTSLEEINTSINKAIAQADRSKNEADRAKNYADAIESINEVRPATKEQIGLVIIGDNINVDERGVIDVPLSSKATQDEEGNEVPEVAGVVTTDDTLVNNNGKIGVKPATTTTLGGIIAGDGLNITEDGTASINSDLLDDKYVKKSGDTVNGELKVNAHASLIITNSTKGTTPAANQFGGIYFTDNSGAHSVQNLLGYVYTSLRSTGASYTAIQNLLNNPDKSEAATIMVGFNAQGQKFTEAPTPPILDSSTQIVTTEWVNNKLARAGGFGVYVEKTGNDNNDGLTPETPLLTIKAAINRAAQFRHYSGMTNIHIGEGIWDEGALTISNDFSRGLNSTNSLVLQGSGKDKTIISTSSSSAFIMNKSYVSFTDMTIESNSGTFVIEARNYSVAFLGNCLIKKLNTGGAVISSVNGSFTTFSSGVEIDCTNAQNGVIANIAGIVDMNNIVSFSGTYGNGVVSAQYGGRVLVRKQPTGSPTGKRYVVATHGIITTNGGNGGPDFIPGTAAGTVSSGGIYL